MIRFFQAILAAVYVPNAAGAIVPSTETCESLSVLDYVRGVGPLPKGKTKHYTKNEVQRK